MSLLQRRILMEGSDEVKEWRILRNITLEEDTRIVKISADDDGSSFSISDFILQINGICDATSDSDCGVYINGIAFPNILRIKKDGTNISSGNFWSEVYNSGRIVIGVNSTGSYGNMVTGGAKQSAKLLLPTEPLTSIDIFMASANVKLKAGAQFILHGR